jgi:serine/threonine protein kinase
MNININNETDTGKTSNSIVDIAFVNDNYRFLQQIGKGSFGVVYLVYDKKNKKNYACKVESAVGKNRLRSESNIYKYFSFKGLKCVPTYQNYIETPKLHLLVMELLGKSINTLFDECNSKMDIGTVIKIGITIINQLEKIHTIGFIYRDIKPDNFMFGTDDSANDMYIIDFGLSKKWIVDGNHIEQKTGRSMIGTARYASVNVHLGTEPSRRDDMESVGYMLVYLINGSLPWQGLKKKSKENPIDKIGDKKMMVDLRELCKGLPSCFYEYINYTKNLQFTEKPDYEYMREIFTSSAKENNIDIEYYWKTSKKLVYNNIIPMLNNIANEGNNVKKEDTATINNRVSDKKKSSKTLTINRKISTPAVQGSHHSIESRQTKRVIKNTKNNNKNNKDCDSNHMSDTSNNIQHRIISVKRNIIKKQKE